MINTVSKYELFYFRFCKIELQDNLNDILSTIIINFFFLIYFVTFRFYSNPKFFKL